MKSGKMHTEILSTAPIKYDASLSVKGYYLNPKKFEFVFTYSFSSGV